jgi:hypothetical protein
MAKQRYLLMEIWVTSKDNILGFQKVALGKGVTQISRHAGIAVTTPANFILA